MTEQQKEYRTLHHAIRSVEKGTTNLIKTQADQRNTVSRTCYELNQADPSLSSGMYLIDPDGEGVGDDPIYVECDMTSGDETTNCYLDNNLFAF